MSVITAMWVFVLMWHTFHVDASCKYMVPVKNHAHVYACSDHPRPIP